MNLTKVLLEAQKQQREVVESFENEQYNLAMKEIGLEVI